MLFRGMIMRSFCSGRRFTCLEVLLALLLSTPISLPAQSASSPQSGTQSQAAQPATSAPSSSQSQDTAPCSSGRPILKRGTQPALPPCPDPPPDAPPAAASAPARSQNPSAKLDRKGQRGGVRIFTKASQLYLPGGHVAVYAAGPGAGDVPGRGFGRRHLR